MNEKIAVIGAGLIGRAWAIVFARAGCSVAIYDAVPEALSACTKLLHDNISDLAKHGLITETPEVVLARIKPVSTLAEALKGAALVQENVKETVEVKRQIFAEMDKLAAPDTILTSSTSWIPTSEFSEHLPGRHRILVAHPVNPPYLVPLVELAPAPWTSEETVKRAHDIYTRAGQSPVLLKKEITGFLLNRIQGAVLNEALNLYENGYASSEDLDKVLKDGLGLRWSFMGPFETIDLNAPEGVIDYAKRYGHTYRDVAKTQLPNEWDAATLKQIEDERRTVLKADQLEERSRWRDNRLMGLVAHKRKQAT
ncbi:3-hydroxyacyl-CoA dehydrogenase [Herbaspirillum sp. 3R11]|nr:MULTISPECIES: 3-hydroxyacyl-CoA dehydrogenase [unclassified Herbaspirillum]RFB74088.1 3-hydroxyacyl-CoA dehydrogenase [Herbaspirillum sp. 3R-3a1]TFI10097.1 3-hydroxyacyl-CoA dehydrogenase [Herbaspirillum sp. 3R11]TFI16001.1 3-hydroxyacyl-CoA dehydrogenase [Herbaspirillum sp. 3R-11]TFI30434.1 3-hydroxyacyl-CoA dehydrogenase [Herbaspirillum sp. 3C11]